MNNYQSRTLAKDALIRIKGINYVMNFDENGNMVGLGRATDPHTYYELSRSNQGRLKG